MGKWIGISCVLLGVLCILSAIGFIAYNRWEDKNAEDIAKDILKDVQSIIDESLPEQTLPDETIVLPDDEENMPIEMATAEVGGYDCIGILSVPVLDLELPVLTDWSYAKLKKAPCHYYGSYFGKDFVIAAHNYQSHFGRLSELQAGDIVVFTDIGGTAHYYEVVILETLPKNATKEMIASGFDLSLYTCTPGGSNRVTVRCNAVALFS